MNQQAMLRKLMKLKQEMEQTQVEIEETEFEANVNGIVTVTVMGTKRLAKIEVSEDFEVADSSDMEMLTDMIIAACNKAYDDVDKTTEQKMAKYQALAGGGLF